MSHIKSFRTVVVAASIMLMGCAIAPKLAEPADPSSAMAVLSVTVMVNTIFGPDENAATEVVIGKVNSTGVVEKEFKQTGRYDKYAIFVNLSPGTYKLLRAFYVKQSTPAPAGGITTSTSFSFSSVARIEFEPEMTQRISTEVPAGAVTYMGDFSTTISPKLAFPLPKYEILKSAGERTDDGKRRAYEMLKTTFADSPWVQRPMK